jgi:hypothetical protein
MSELIYGWLVSFKLGLLLGLASIVGLWLLLQVI